MNSGVTRLRRTPLPAVPFLPGRRAGCSKQVDLCLGHAGRANARPDLGVSAVGFDTHGLSLFQRWLLPGLSLPARAGPHVALLPL